MKRTHLNLKRLMMPMLLLVALLVPHVLEAATASGETGKIITLRIDQYSSTGSSIYNDLLSGRMYARSYTWTSSNEGVTTWVDKANTFAYVKFSSPGTYTVNYNLDYTFSGSTRSYKFSATWTVKVESSGPTGISVNADKKTIKVGESTNVSATLYGGNGTVSWRKSNTGVSLNDYGTRCTVTGVSAGTTRITATTNNGYSDYVDITVVEPNDISLSSSSLEMTVGETETVTAEISGYNSSRCVWRSSDQSIVKVTASGKTAELTALAAGSATVTAEAYDGTTATCRVTVKANSLQDLYVVGALTDWEFLDDFKFSSSDNGETYILYLDYLGGEFKVASPEFAISLGCNSSFALGEAIKLAQNENNLMTPTGLEHLKLVYTSANNTLKVNHAYRPIDNSVEFCKVFFTLNSVGGYLAQNVVSGSRIPIQLYVDEGWKSQSWIYDEANADDTLYDKANHTFLTHRITSDCVIGVIFEKISDGADSAEVAGRARLIMTKDGVRVADIADGVTIELTDLKGMSKTLIPVSDLLDIPLNSNNVYVISLSNGQTFKVVR